MAQWLLIFQMALVFRPCCSEGKTIHIQEQSPEKIRKKRAMSALSTRSSSMFQSEKFLRSVHFSSSKVRPQTGHKKEMVRPITAENLKFLKKSPLVVYPFESKLKIRRVDDNPKILERVIARKSKNSEK